MVFQDSTNLNAKTKYIVDANGDTPYTTIQSAINAANTAGVDATIYVRPGTYNESLTLYDGIDLEGKNTNTIIVGTHTPPAAGSIQFFSLTLQSATDIFSSAAAGSTSIELYDCIATCTNGYVFNLLNWTGTLSADICNFDGTDNGVVNNTGNATIFFTSASIGAGTGNSMVVSGNLTFENIELRCPISLQGTGTSIMIMGCYITQTLTTAATHTLTIENTTFSVGASAAISHGSANALTLSDVTINSSNNPAIAGAGAGNLVLGSVTYLSNSNLAGTLTVSRATKLDIGGVEGTTSDFATSITSPIYTTDSADMNINSAAGQDIILQMGDAAGANIIDFEDSTSATVASLDSNGTLTVVNMDGIIGATTPAAGTFTTCYATTFDTNVAAAGVTLAGTTLSADGTDANINIEITPKGTGVLQTASIGNAASTTAIAISSSSQVTKPLQPTFFAYVSSTITNVTGNGALYQIVFDTESFDIGSNYNNGTGVFTAPIAGYYQFNTNVRVTGTTIASGCDMYFDTTGGGSSPDVFTSFFRAAAAIDFVMSLSSVVYLAASGTCAVKISVSGEAGNTDDILGAATAYTHFSGYLLG